MGGEGTEAGKGGAEHGADLQVGVKAPGTPKRMTFLPAASAWTETCCSWSLSSNHPSWPSGRESPTAIGAMAAPGVWDADGDSAAGQWPAWLRVGGQQMMALASPPSPALPGVFVGGARGPRVNALIWGNLMRSAKRAGRVRANWIFSPTFLFGGSSDRDKPPAEFPKKKACFLGPVKKISRTHDTDKAITG